MKTTFLLTAVQNGAKRISMGLFVAVAVTSLQQDATAIETVNLGTASSFAILAGTAITDAGGASTIVKGDVGVYDGTSDGLLAGQLLNGTRYSRAGDDVLLLQAKNDLTAAYLDAAGRTPFTTLVGIAVPGDNQLGGQTLVSGVYRFASATTANLDGILTLDAQGDPNAVWIFQATTDLITASSSSVVFTDGIGSSCNVFWQIGTSAASLGTDSSFVGTILALTAINVKTGATVDGRLLARNAEVTLDHNTITRPCCGEVPDSGSTLLLLGFGLATLLGFSRRFFSVA